MPKRRPMTTVEVELALCLIDDPEWNNPFTGKPVTQAQRALLRVALAEDPAGTRPTDVLNVDCRCGSTVFTIFALPDQPTDPHCVTCHACGQAIGVFAGPLEPNPLPVDDYIVGR